MNMNWKSLACGMVIGSVLFSGITYAAPKAVKLFVNGAELHTEVPAQIVDGSTLIPARALAEALGSKVVWDEKNQSVTIENEKYRHLLRKKGDISELDAIGLVSDAQRHFWVISSGGGGDHKDGSFPYKGSDYRWMASDLDTKSKYIEYMELLYTPEQAQAFWKKQMENDSIVEIDGKLAQPNADGGSALAWSEAKAKLIQDSKTSGTYQFSVPIHDQVEVKVVKMRYVEGKGWRIDEPIETVR
jgi:hypothetical protein